MTNEQAHQRISDLVTSLYPRTEQAVPYTEWNHEELHQLVMMTISLVTCDDCREDVVRGGLDLNCHDVNMAYQTYLDNPEYVQQVVYSMFRLGYTKAIDDLMNERIVL